MGNSSKKFRKTFWKTFRSELGNTFSPRFFISILILLVIFIPIAILTHDLSKRTQVLIILPIAAVLKYTLTNYMRTGSFFEEN